MIEQVTVTALKHLIDTTNPTIIDVREHWEFEQGHVPGARWVPMAMVPGRQDEFSSDQPVYVVCRSGNRSGQVVMWLAQQGIRTVNVAGGTAEWQSHGYPIDTTPAERTLTS